MFTFRNVRKTLLVASITTQKQLWHFQLQMFFFYFIDCTILTNLYFKQNEKKNVCDLLIFNFIEATVGVRLQSVIAVLIGCLLTLKSSMCCFILQCHSGRVVGKKTLGGNVVDSLLHWWVHQVWQCRVCSFSVLEGSAAWHKSSSVQDNFLLLWDFF